MKMDNIEAYIKFKKECEISKDNFTKKIFKLKNDKKKYVDMQLLQKVLQFLITVKLEKKL